MLGLYFFFKGYVRAEVIGQLKEKIINGCVRNGVFMWNIKTRGDAVSFNIRRCDADKLVKIADGAKVVFSDKMGLAYVFERFRKRYALIAGVLFFIASIVFLSSLVWKINISGCDITDAVNIQKILEENGVRKWIFKNKIDEDYLEMRIMSDLDTLSWINVEVKGTNLNIKVENRREIPEVIDNEPTDLVAGKDGVIYALRIKNGEEMVAVGDTVVKGQLLVSALVERDGEYVLPEPYTVRSRGEVIARTWYTFDIKQPLVESFREYTGNEIKRTKIGVSDFDIKLYFEDVPYKNYEIKKKRYGGFFRLESETIREVLFKETVYTTDEALKKAEDEACAMLPDDVYSSKCITRELKEEDGFVNLYIVFECTENIAVETKFKERETTDDGKDGKIQ